MMTTLAQRLGWWGTWSLLALASLATVLPFWVMLCLALQPAAQVAAGEASWWWPQQATLANITTVINQLALGRAAFNSTLVSVSTTLGHVLLAALAGFALARLRLPGRRLWYGLIVLTLMIPPQVNMVPLFWLMSRLGWMDTYAALIVPGLFGGFGVMLYRHWFSQLPLELEEAASLDGCSPLSYWWYIALPLAQPITVTLGLFVLIGSWNSFMWPLIVTFSPSMQTLPVALASLKGAYRDSLPWAVLMAGATLATLPVLLLSGWAQQGVMRGLNAGSGKE
jgi:multiple sugar transport system permease protein